MYCSACGREIVNESNFCYLCGARQTSARAYYRPQTRLERSATDYKIAGVCGGLAKHWDLDPTLVRVVWVLLVLFPVPFVPAVLGYFVCWIVIPKEQLPVYVAAPAAAAPGAMNAQPR